MLKINSLKLLNGKVLTYEASPGDIVMVKGVNGTGKSLFLKTLSRILPKEAGEILWNEKISGLYQADLWRSKIMYLPSEVSFSEELSVDEYLEEPYELLRYKDLKSEFRPRDHFQDYNSKMSLLSSGQSQKLALLRAMALNADVLLLDESFSHMDTASREESLLLLKAWASPNKILFIVSHFDVSAGASAGQFGTREFHL